MCPGRVCEISPLPVITPLVALSSTLMILKFIFLKKNYFIYFNWKIITLQYCDDFCHTSTWIAIGICVPLPALSHLSPHPILLGCPRALALGTLLHASNLHWSSVLHMVMYIFQCSSLKSSRPCLLKFRARSPLPTKREKKLLTGLIPFPLHCLHIHFIKGHRVPTSWALGSVPCLGFQIRPWHGPCLRGAYNQWLLEDAVTMESWLSYKYEMNMCQWFYLRH